MEFFFIFGRIENFYLPIYFILMIQTSKVVKLISMNYKNLERGFGSTYAYNIL